MFEQETWRFINSFAPWLSAIGTISVVILTLYFSRRDKFINLKIDIGIRTIIQEGLPPRHNLFTIKITNIGLRKAKVDGLGMKIGFFKPIYLQLIPFKNDFISGNIPIVLDEGESVSYYYPLNFLNRDYLEEIKKLSNSTFFKMYAYTSIDKTFSCRIPKNVKLKLIQETRKKIV